MELACVCERDNTNTLQLHATTTDACAHTNIHTTLDVLRKMEYLMKFPNFVARVRACQGEIAL